MLTGTTPDFSGPEGDYMGTGRLGKLPFSHHHHFILGLRGWLDCLIWLPSLSVGAVHGAWPCHDGQGTWVNPERAASL